MMSEIAPFQEQSPEIARITNKKEKDGMCEMTTPGVYQWLEFCSQLRGRSGMNEPNLESLDFATFGYRSQAPCHWATWPIWMCYHSFEWNPSGSILVNH